MIGNVFNIKQLEAFVWVASLGSFRKAAHHMNTTQPNISARIAGLEKTLGVTLMQRDAGSIQLTDKGAEILAASQKVLREAEQIVEIADRADLVSDRLRLGVTELVACTWLHAYLRQIKSIYPVLNVELTVDLSRNLDNDMSANKLDLAIQTAPFNSKAAGIVELGKFDYIWVAAPQVAAALHGSNTVADLIPHTVMTHARHTQACMELADHFAKLGLPTARFVASSSLASCVQMAADGMGVTLLPRALVEREVADGRLVAVQVNWTPTPLRFAARYQSDAAARFVSHAAYIAADAVAAFRADVG